jgi:hypothetical protein
VPETVAPSAPAVPSFDPEQAKQMAQSLDALLQAVERLAATQDQMKSRLAVVVPSLRPLIRLDALGKREDPRSWHCTAIAFRQSMRSNRATETVAP